ncbi:MAG: OprO/OprP family phosphate-selective porin, partial [Desulfobacterales bacterium]
DDADIMSLEAAMVMGPFSAQGEYMQSFVGSDAANDPDFSGYYVYGSYFLTGESRNYKPGSGSFGRVKPNRDFSFHKQGAGAWELGVRYSSLDLNDESIEGGELNDLTLGVNWHLNPNVRTMINYVYADLEDRADVDDDSANILQARFQVDF